MRLQYSFLSYDMPKGHVLSSIVLQHIRGVHLHELEGRGLSEQGHRKARLEGAVS